MTDIVIKKWKQKLRNMKKEDYIVLLLMGVLLLIISLPVEKDKNKKEGAVVLENESGTERENETTLFGETAKKEKNTASEAERLNNNMSYDLDAYVERLEKRTQELLSGMEGAGKVQVMLTVSDTGMEILERNREVSASDLEETDDSGGRRKNTENTQREEVIYQRDGGGYETPYVVQRKLPEVTGVVVMAEGAGNVKVKENIIGAVGVLFNLNEHRIKVIRMKS